jgi:ammonium transporter, Amt family
LLAGIGCAYAVGLKYRFGFDDSLDVVGVHLVGGILGTLLVGLFADPASPAKVSGLLYGGGLDQLWRQATAAGAVLVYSFVLSFGLAKFVQKVIGFRMPVPDEVTGIDLAEHSEVGYDLTPVQHSAFRNIRQTLYIGADETADV